MEQLLWRLAQGGGVMASSPPAPQYRSPLGLDLHSIFITFCLDHNLQYLLYTYLEHYRCVFTVPAASLMRLNSLAANGLRVRPPKVDAQELSPPDQSERV